MIIRCWGTRGSIPVSGREYVKYGGDTTCIEVKTKDDEIIIIDAGSGIRRLGNKLLNENRYNYTLLFTHAHWDHLLGFPFFKPIYIKGTHIKMAGCPYAQKSIHEMVSKSMTPPYFPVNFKDVKAEISYLGACKDNFSINSLVVTPIMLSHPNQSTGFKFVEGDKCFVFMTDNELSFKHEGGLDYKDYLNFVFQADLLMHDSEYTEEEYKTKKTWGHSTYKESLKLALEAGVEKLGLIHHDQDRTDSDIDKIVQNCQHIIEQHKSDLECFAVFEDMEIIL
jgi:phosphoribosyl 1,2-cyclic phosphodiesterase